MHERMRTIQVGWYSIRPRRRGRVCNICVAWRGGWIARSRREDGFVWDSIR